MESIGLGEKEFETFGGLLEKAQRNFQTGMGQLDEVVGTRTRAIQRQLRNVEELPAVDSSGILPTDVIEKEKDWLLGIASGYQVVIEDQIMMSAAIISRFEIVN